MRRAVCGAQGCVWCPYRTSLGMQALSISTSHTAIKGATNLNCIKGCINAIQSLQKALCGLQQTNEIWNQIKQKQFKLNAVEYTLLLKSCAQPSHLDFGQDIMRHLRSDTSLKRDNILTTAIVNMYSRCGRPELALSLWHDHARPDRVLYMVFLMACTEAKRYHLIQKSIHILIFNTRLDVGRRVHGHMKLHNLQMEPKVLACLVKMYTKCGEPQQVTHIWQSILKHRIVPDATLYTALLTACADWAKTTVAVDELCESKDISGVLGVGRMIHNHVIKSRTRYITELNSESTVNHRL